MMLPEIRRPDSLTDTCFIGTWVLFTLWITYTSTLWAPLVLIALLLSTPNTVSQPLIAARAMIVLIKSTSKIYSSVAPTLSPSGETRVPLKGPSSSLNKRVGSPAGSE